MFKFFFVATLIAFVAAESEDHHADTTLWKTDLRHDGWDSEVETTNHIRQAAHGDEHGNIEGDFSWVDPHGEHAEVKYVADKLGYYPNGNIVHPNIVKALEILRKLPAQVEEHHNHH